MLMFPGFETAIRTRSGEEGEAAASGKAQPQPNGPTSSIGARLLQRATTGKDAQPGKIQKRIKTIKRVKSY